MGARAMRSVLVASAWAQAKAAMALLQQAGTLFDQDMVGIVDDGLDLEKADDRKMIEDIVQEMMKVGMASYSAGAELASTLGIEAEKSARNARVIWLHNLGVTVDSIAESVDISRPTVYSIFKNAKIAIKKDKRTLKELAAREAAEKLKKHKEDVEKLKQHVVKPTKVSR